MQITDQHSFNVLGDVLETLRFRGSIFFDSKLSAPWGMSLTQVNNPRFHIALEGDFCIGTDKTESGHHVINVKQMDMVMLPHGNMHWVADKTGRRLIPSEHASEACDLGMPLFQQGKTTQHLMCGLVHYEREIVHPIIDSLPSVLHFSIKQTTDPLWQTVLLIQTELQRPQDYHTAIVDRLTEVLFLQLLRQYAEENQEITGFFAALGNQRLHHALALIHAKPQIKWTIPLLCQQVGMSSATLNRHFINTIGLSPMAYITNWRMIKAYQLTKHTRKSLDDIADTVGFSTARTLNKAFQRYYGYTPNELRCNNK